MARRQDRTAQSGSADTIEKHGINGYIMELDPKYFDVIVKRWCDFTGKDATLESDGTKFDRKG